MDLIEQAYQRLRCAIDTYLHAELRDHWRESARLTKVFFTQVDRDHQFRQIDEYGRLQRQVLKISQQMDLIRKEVRSMNSDAFSWYFITVGYDDANITVDKIRKYSERVSMLKQFREVVYVNEKFRKNDKGDIYIHHHTHFLVKSESSPSKVLQYVYQAVKNVVAGQNFVDVKGPRKKNASGDYNYYLRYVKGDKTLAKMECVEKDREWRIQNNLEQKSI